MSFPIAENAILASLSADETPRLERLLTLVEFGPGEVLCEAGEAVRVTSFPVNCILSSVTTMEDGASIEGLLTGREGVTGAALFGVTRSPWRVIVQVEGRALNAALADLLRELAAFPNLQQRLGQQAHAMQQQATQSVACNRFHPIHERLARWLLMVLDRTDGPEVKLTHEFIAQMLGTYRPSVTVAIATLERAGIVERSRRGYLLIPDRAALEAASCECYRRITQYLEESENPDWGGRD